MPAVTEAQLNNASRDADDLGLIVNSAATDPDITTRLGEVVPPVAKAVALIEEAAASALPNLPIFTTVAAGAASATIGEGQYYGVPETYGLYARVYLKTSGVGVPTTNHVLYGDGFEAKIIQEMTKSQEICGQLPAGCIVDLDMIDVIDSDGRWVKNRVVETSPSLNYINFPSGEIRNEGSGPTIDHFFSGNIVNVNMASINQALTLNAADPVTPSGVPWIMGFQARSHVGAGAQTIRYGPSNDYQTVVLAEGAMISYSHAFSGTDNRLPRITTASGGTANIDLDKVQVQEGATLETFAFNGIGHLKGSYSYRGCLTRNGYYLTNAGGDGCRGLFFLGNGIVRTTFNEITVLTGERCLAVSNDAPILSAFYDNDGSPTISSATFGSYVDNFVTAAGEFSLRPGQNSSHETGCYVIGGTGWKIVGSAYSIADLEEAEGGPSHIGYVNGIPILRDYASNSAINLIALGIGSAGATMDAEPTTTTFNGDYSNILVFNRKLNFAEVQLATSNLRARMRLKNSPIKVSPYTFIAFGDSKTAWKSIPSWYWQLAITLIPTCLDGSPKFQGINAANGGTSFGQIWSTTPSVQFDSFYKCFMREVLPAIKAAQAIGSIPIVILPEGTNDLASIQQPPGSYNPGYSTATQAAAGWSLAKAGWENYRDIFFIPMMQAIRAAFNGGPGEIWVPDTDPRTDVSGVNFENGISSSGGRVAWNNWKRTNAVALGLVDEYISWAGSGWDTPAAATTANYLTPDGIHDMPAGSLYKAQMKYLPLINARVG